MSIVPTATASFGCRSIRSPLGSLLVSGVLIWALAWITPPVAARSGTSDYQAATYGTDAGTGEVAEEPTWSETPYSWIRTAEGPATLVPGDGGEAEAVEVHLPVLVGDHLLVPSGSRLEVVLSDGNLVRIGGDTELAFQQVAGAPEVAPEAARGDRDDSALPKITILRLVGGEVQLEVSPHAYGETPPVVETPSATVYLNQAGSYRVSVWEGHSAGDGGTRVIVREGHAEVVSERGSMLVHPGEKALLVGGDYPRAELAAAPPLDGLESWGRELSLEADRQAEALRSQPLEDDLAYAAAPLAEYGEWLTIDGQRCWRPAAGPDWRPYVDGYWRSTPLGNFWVSHEPWGWVPYHYGSWNFDAAYGWVWFPGYRFAPAWVYWYWGPQHVAWVPYGYYHRHHHHSLLSLHIGGHHHDFRHWSFVDHHHLHHRRLRHHVVRGDHYPRHTGRHAVPRGRVSPDSRQLDPGERMAPRRVAERTPVDRRAGRRGPAAAERVLERRPLDRRDLARRDTDRRGFDRRGATDSGVEARRVGPRGSTPGDTTRRLPTDRTLGERRTTDTGVTARRVGPRPTERTESRRIEPRGSETPRTTPRANEPRRIEPRRTETPRTTPRTTTPRATGPRLSEPRRVEPRRPTQETRRVTPQSSPRAEPPTRRVTPRRPSTETPTARRPVTRRPTTQRPTIQRSSPRATPRRVAPRSRATPGRSTPSRVTPRTSSPTQVRPSSPSPRRPTARPSTGSSSRPTTRSAPRSSPRPRAGVSSGSGRSAPRARPSQSGSRRSSGDSRGRIRGRRGGGG